MDIKVNGFWSRGQEAFFDVRVFHPNAPTYRNRDLTALYRMHEGIKKREYGERVREFALIRSAIMTIRGSKGACGFASDIPLASFEGKVGP